MAMRAVSARPGIPSEQDNELFTRYMRALLRTGGTPEPGDDMRTCTSCGTHAVFEPCTDNDTWCRCSTCGALA